MTMGEEDPVDDAKKSRTKRVKRPGTSINLDHVEAFLNIFEHGSLAGAAKAMSLASPTLNGQMKDLARALGVAALFSHAPGGPLGLTEAGRRFLTHAKEIRTRCHMALQVFRSSGSAGRGPLRLAAAPSLCSYFLPDALLKFNKAQPDCAVHVVACHSSEAVQRVLLREADLGIGYSLENQDDARLGLKRGTITTERLVLVHRRHRPTRNDSRTATATSKRWWESLILYERGATTWARTKDFLEVAGIEAVTQHEVDSVETAKRLVLQGLGFSFLPGKSVEAELGNRSLEEVRLIGAAAAGSRALDRPIHIVGLSGEQLTNEARLFLSILRGRESAGKTVRGLRYTRDRDSGEMRRTAGQSDSDDLFSEV